jgi:hypothetical protein
MNQFNFEQSWCDCILFRKSSKLLEVVLSKEQDYTVQQKDKSKYAMTLGTKLFIYFLFPTVNGP